MVRARDVGCRRTRFATDADPACPGQGSQIRSRLGTMTHQYGKPSKRHRVTEGQHDERSRKHPDRGRATIAAHGTPVGSSAPVGSFAPVGSSAAVADESTVTAAKAEPKIVTLAVAVAVTSVIDRLNPT